MTVVAKILQSKPEAAVYSIGPSDSVFDALRLMADKGIGALLVMDGEAIAGIFTERDYARKIALMGRTSTVTQVKDVMTSAVLFVRPDQTSEDCMQIMSSHRLRHLPVVDNGKAIGMISIGDLVKDIISEQKYIIEQLEQYIVGAR
ncbi:CBS domain-containing protein [Acidovorax sp. RAC01]|uniref:CBS domain-containing protein n=1 Tax=Acidovorax sp. RAC01 TaxID=1842533 RepID=UPI00083E7FFD|nr:CBS domain-containing protein [Acidovorax sp. RAC01]AOG21739.1 CBS domain protein [Acidovorax sp. RAC01]